MATIKKASELNYIGRLKQVSTLHFRGFSNRKIAAEMETDEKTIRKMVAIITDQVREFDDINSHLNDLIARTGEELTKLNELEAEQWKLLDWCTEEVVQVDGFGNPLKVIDCNTGKLTDEVQVGPRKPTMIPTVTAQIANLSKQRAELLKLIGPKVDISVKLQLQEQTQVRILEVLRELAPDTYAQLHRELTIIAESIQGEAQKALPAGVFDAEFEEIPDGE